MTPAEIIAHAVLQEFDSNWEDNEVAEFEVGKLRCLARGMVELSADFQEFSERYIHLPNLFKDAKLDPLDDAAMTKMRATVLHFTHSVIQKEAACDEVERRLKERANRINEATRLIEFLAHDESDVIAADARKWLADVKQS